MKSTDVETKKWIALFEVIPCDGGPYSTSFNGALMHVIGLADNSEEFVSIVSSTLLNHGIQVVGVKDTEPLSRRLEYGYISKELCEGSESISASRPIFLGELNAW